MLSDDSLNGCALRRMFEGCELSLADQSHTASFISCKIVVETRLSAHSTVTAENLVTYWAKLLLLRNHFLHPFINNHKLRVTDFTSKNKMQIHRNCKQVQLKRKQLLRKKLKTVGEREIVWWICLHQNDIKTFSCAIWWELNAAKTDFCI